MYSSFFTLLLLPLSSLVTLTISAAVPGAASAASIQCAKSVHIIATPAHGTDGTPRDLEYLIVSISKYIPGATNETVNYPSDSLSIIDAVNQGSDLARAAITNYVAACPKAKLVLLGYSEGAVCTMDAMCGTSMAGFNQTSPLSSKYAKNIIAAIVYGDESQVGGQSWDKGTCKTVGPLTRLNPAGCDAFAASIHSYCSAQDALCCVGGTTEQAHLEYFAKDDTAATKFVVSRYRATL